MLANEAIHFARDCQIEAQYLDAASLGIKLQLCKKWFNYKALTVSDMCHIILLWLQTNFCYENKWAYRATMLFEWK